MSAGTASRTCTIKSGNKIDWSGSKVECTGMQTRHTQHKLILDPWGMHSYVNRSRMFIGKMKKIYRLEV